MYHIPVLAKESIDALSIFPDGIYVDATFGGGGHSQLILKHLSENGKLFAFDQDNDATANIIEDKRFNFIQQNFRFIYQYLHFYDTIPVDGIFADLGVSSHQIDKPERGFSYMHANEDLDMRMNKSQTKTASEILNTYTEEQLTDLFFNYAEINFARKLSNRILKFRINNQFKIVSNLTNIIDEFVSPQKKFSIYSRVFQALRIEVNDEIGALHEFLTQAYNSLKVGGRLVVISYHSVEDRIVKNFFKSGNISGIIEKDFYGNKKSFFEIITKKPIVASESEVEVNTRSRSAKLRAAIKL